MPNSFLSPTIITREALRILHANLNFIGNINRQYDDQFANSGASPSGKIGPSLTIRMPNQFTVRSGATIAVQDITESSQTLTVATQKGVDMNITTASLTLTIDEFSARYLKPAISRLASEIEADALSMQKDIYNQVPLAGASADFVDFANARRKLNEFLAPDDGQRCAILRPSHAASVLTAMKGLFNPQETVSKQYKTGKLSRMVGFDFYENTLIPAYTSGTEAGTVYQVNGPNQSGATITVKTGANTFVAGDIVTFAGCNAVHYETKADLGYLKQFVVTTNYAGGGGNLAISPAIVLTGATQNVSAAPTDSGTVTKFVGASASIANSLLFHPDAFTFVTADLMDVSKFGAWGAREVMDGISMRIARQYDIVNDKLPTRIDVLYGYKTIRPELAVRLA